MEYTMSQVTHLTGIQAHTLRVWERRYDFIKAKRKESKFRYYTEEQLRKLLLTAVLLNNGFRISSVAKLSDSELDQEVEAVFQQNTDINSDQTNALILAMLTFDEDLFTRVYDKSVAQRGVLFAFTNLIYPFLNIIGGLWMYNKANPAQEHFISNLIRQKLVAAIEGLPTPPPNAPQIAMFLLEGDNHELGLLLGYYIAKHAGWRVFYLGIRVPASDLISIFENTNVKTLFSTFTINNPSQQEKLIEIVQERNDTKLLVSGFRQMAETFENISQITYLDSPEKLLEFLVEESVSV